MYKDEQQNMPDTQMRYKEEEAEEGVFDFEKTGCVA
jgi:hypothetical protein